MHPMNIGVLRPAWDTRLLIPGMGKGGVVDSDGASGVAFWEVSWEDGWAIAWPDVMLPPPQTRPSIPCRARLAGVEVSTPRLGLISRETSPRTPEVVAILARRGRSTTSMEGEAVSNWGGFPAHRWHVTRG